MTTAPRPTMADVAAAAGVSRALVSIVIRGAAGASASTRAHVLEVAQQLGYRPDTRARLLRSSRTRLLGVVFNVTEPFHAELVELLYAAGEALGYALTLSATGSRRGEQTAMESLLDLGVEAIIVIAPTTPAEKLAGAPVPIVAMLDSPSGPGAQAVSSVRTDEAAGIRLAIDHLRRLGHRHIAHIDGGTAVGSAARRQAYEQAMAEAGESPRIFDGGPLEYDGSRAAGKLLAARDAPVGTGPAAGAPTAVVVFNDRSALGALDTFRTAGVDVPVHMSVVGYDNSRMARLEHINLTSIGQDGPALAAAAVAAAAGRIGGGPVGDTVIAPWLELGGTTAAPIPPGS
ncbi:MAG: LacI family DNA-binding transcriptional regulator [Specibacter sp.]